MSTSVVLLALFAAVLHASWNAFLRSGADRFWMMTVMNLAITVAAIPVVVIFPVPVADAWPYIIGSSLFQVAYGLLLVAAYRHGELGQVYPIIRGSAPLLVTVGSFFLMGEVLQPLAMLGVLCIVLGYHDAGARQDEGIRHVDAVCTCDRRGDRGLFNP